MDFELFKYQSSSYFLKKQISPKYFFLVHLFLRQPDERIDAPYNDYDILEIFCLVSMMKFGIPNLDNKSPISYNEAKEFFLDLTGLMVDGVMNEEFQQNIVKAFLHPLFSRDTIPMEFLDWDIFLNAINGQLKYAQYFLRWIFSYKLLVQETCFVLPGFDRSSHFTEISNSTGLAFLMMSNIYMSMTSFIKVVYSSNNEGLVFEKLVKRLIEYDGPTFLFIKNVKGCIYGGFKPDKWEINREKTQGNTECYIFSLWPKLQNFFLMNEEKIDPKNAAYLNDAKQAGNRGLGKFLNFF